MNFFVIPAQAGIYIQRLARRLAWIRAFAGMTLLLFMLPACAHKATLKTPTEMAKDQLKKEKEAQQRAKRDAARAEKKAVESTHEPVQQESSQEVTVPEVAH